MDGVDSIRHSRLRRAQGVVLAAALLFTASLAGQEPAKRLFEQEPFDRITLDGLNDNAVLVVEPLELPNRRVPAKHRPGERLKVKIKEDDREFSAAWANIVKVELFEEMVLAEADQLAAAGKLDEAYDYFDFLIDKHPTTQGLPASRQAYLYLCAGTAFKQQKYHEALAVLEELWTQNPTFKLNDTSPSLTQILSSAVDKLLEKYVAAADYRSSRTLLSRVIGKFDLRKGELAQRWVGKFEQLAGAERDAAQTHLAAGRYIEAHDAMGRMLNIWPQVQGASELAAEIAERYPLVVVGVTQPARSFDAGSLLDLGARRAGKLVERRFCEFAGFGLEGGRYVCPWGDIERSEDGLTLMFDIRSTQNAAVTGPEVAARLLDLADPASPFRVPAWSRLVKAVRVKNVQHVEVDLRMPHVLPEALLQVSLSGGPAPQKQGERGSGPYFPLLLSEKENRFTKNPDDLLAVVGQPAEIMERWYDDPQRAVLALQRGEIDVIDRVQPADLAAVRALPDVAVAPYAAPVTHVLLPGRPNVFVANKTFRRGLQYAIARQEILDVAIGQKVVVPGNVVVSGPFPAPKGDNDSSLKIDNDPAGYGYDSRIEPRPFDLRLGYTLRVMGEREVAAQHQNKGQAAPALKPLVLGHPAEEPIRKACKAIAAQWKTIKVECQLLEFPPGICTDLEGKCDLVYAQITAWEPVVDAGRLLGPGGAAPTTTPHLALALRQIESARTWRDAHDRLKELHRIIHEDLTIIPLWQTSEHFAYRKSIRGLGPGIVTLYQNVQGWRLTARASGGRSS